ncbi:5143_t:CDS:2, partial [Gigaspora margarita]
MSGYRKIKKRTTNRIEAFEKRKKYMKNAKRDKYPGGEEKVQGCRKKYAPKNKEELTKKEKGEGESTHLSRKWKTESGLALAKSLEPIISFLMSDIKTKLYKEIQKGMPVVLTNNSALGYQQSLEKLIEQKEDSKGENSED